MILGIGHSRERRIVVDRSSRGLADRSNKLEERGVICHLHFQLAEHQPAKARLYEARDPFSFVSGILRLLRIEVPPGRGLK
jgi:hypothetical protein